MENPVKSYPFKMNSMTCSHMFPYGSHENAHFIRDFQTTLQTSPGRRRAAVPAEAVSLTVCAFWATDWTWLAMIAQ